MIQCEATITKITTMRDKTIRLQVDTQEIPAEHEAELFKLRESFGVFAFAEAEINPENIKVPNYAKIEKQDKSPSERLRKTLYVLWDKAGLKVRYPDFDDFYRAKTEEIINHFKKQISEIY
jgi:hypothetical protein